LTDHILDRSLPPTFLHISTLNAIHHSRLTVRLSDSPDLYPLPIDLVFGQANKLIKATSLLRAL